MENKKFFDEGLRDLIVWLNENGIKTYSSCSGHPKDYKSEGIIVFKSVEDCKNFMRLIPDVSNFNRIGFQFNSKKVIYFEYDEGLNQEKINSIWIDLFEKIKLKWKDMKK